jgi:dTDP-4-dehydrorhamnose 3,5-epimerase
VEDARGFFARMFDSRVFEAAGLSARFVNVNNSFSRARGTLRGLHLQNPPSAEAKLVRCVRGAIFDVAADLRAGSPTRGRWFGVELTDENRAMLYVPEGCAHGFLTLTDDSETIYFSSQYHDAARERGVRWNDKATAIAWPIEPAVISDKDRAWPDYDPGNFP